MMEEEIERLIQSQTRMVKFTKHNLFEYLIYKIALARAERNLYLAERNILVWNIKKKQYTKNRRNSLP